MVVIMEVRAQWNASEQWPLARASGVTPGAPGNDGSGRPRGRGRYGGRGFMLALPGCSPAGG
jgi:hypothetical protein